MMMQSRRRKIFPAQLLAKITPFRIFGFARSVCLLVNRDHQRLCGLQTDILERKRVNPMHSSSRGRGEADGWLALGLK